ncbi:MAG TPA: amidohydrolase family protein, partial [Streptosporangiaceae bacterium]|nr:amidohydrolase family protein [Streptosporangiaceae bacterium]
MDDHLIEHPRVWLDRLPEHYRAEGPQIIEDDQGHHVWRYEGRLYPQIGLNAVAGKDAKDYGAEPVRYEDMIPGCYDPVERVKDMDLDGVQAACCYPSFPGFAGRVFLQAEDPTLAGLCVQAWNDFSTDEWAAAAPDRFIPLAMLPVWDVAASVREIERVAAKGAKGVTFPENPAPLGLPSFHTDHWDPFFAACLDTDTVVTMHIGSGGMEVQTSPDAPM